MSDPWAGWKKKQDDLFERLTVAVDSLYCLRAEKEYNVNDYVDLHLAEIDLLLAQAAIQLEYARLARTNR